MEIANAEGELAGPQNADVSYQVLPLGLQPSGLPSSAWRTQAELLVASTADSARHGMASLVTFWVGV